MKKYTEKNLYDKEEKIFLPYVNKVMKNITIKEKIFIKIKNDGEIVLFNIKNNNRITLFYTLRQAILNEILLSPEKYKDFIELKKTKKTKEVIEYEFKKGEN